MATFKLFGFRISNDNEKPMPNQVVRTFTPPEADGSYQAMSGDGYVSHVVDFDGKTNTENNLINTYREISMVPEVDTAIEDIISEMIVTDEFKDPIQLEMTNLKLPNSTKKKISEEFSSLLRMMDFKTKGHDILKRWYVDGRYYLHILVDENNISEGINKLRYVDPRNLKLVREKISDQRMLSQVNAIFPGVYKVGDEIRYWIYLEQKTQGSIRLGINTPGLKIAYQSIGYANSGIIDPSTGLILSFLHKAIRPANQLKMLEDAQVVYIFTRAPERRIFYIDTGNLPQGRAEQYADSVMKRLKNRINYDAATGEVTEARKFVALTEDIYIPRRASSQATSVETLPGGANADMTAPLEYFQKKLSKAMNVPFSRMSEEAKFSLGKSVEVSRDEAKYARFIARLRTRFAMLLNQLLSRQLALKGIMTLEEWDEVSDDIHYDYLHDNYFSEMIENEVLMERLNLLNIIGPFLQTHFSLEFARKKILRQSDEEIEDLKQQREDEEPEIEELGLGPDGMIMPPMDPNAMNLTPAPFMTGGGGAPMPGQAMEQPPMMNDDNEEENGLSEEERRLADSMSNFFSVLARETEDHARDDFDSASV